MVQTEKGKRDRRPPKKKKKIRGAAVEARNNLVRPITGKERTSNFLKRKPGGHTTPVP